MIYQIKERNVIVGKLLPLVLDVFNAAKAIRYNNDYLLLV